MAQDFIKEARQKAGLQNTYRVVAHGRRIISSYIKAHKLCNLVQFDQDDFGGGVRIGLFKSRPIHSSLYPICFSRYDLLTSEHVPGLR